MKTLIVFSSRYGQTQKIADRIGVGLREAGHENEVMAVQETHRLKSLDDYNQVILGSPIYISRHSKPLAQFIKKFRGELSKKRTLFFSVSLSAGGTETQQQDARNCMVHYLKQTHWRPDRNEIFAGSLPYREYGWMTRWLMKRIVRRSGGDIDTSRDFEYTDWNKVEALVASLVDSQVKENDSSPIEKSAVEQ